MASVAERCGWPLLNTHTAVHTPRRSTHALLTITGAAHRKRTTGPRAIRTSSTVASTRTCYARARGAACRPTAIRESRCRRPTPLSRLSPSVATACHARALQIRAVNSGRAGARVGARRPRRCRHEAPRRCAFGEAGPLPCSARADRTCPPHTTACQGTATAHVEACWSLNGCVGDPRTDRGEARAC